VTAARRIYRGMPLGDAVRVCRELGGLVEEGHRGGELRFSHPLARGGERRVCHSQDRDASVAVVAWLQAIARTLRDLEQCLGEIPAEAAQGRS
jgi:hypothetical protein